jgi:hypothetical protein
MCDSSPWRFESSRVKILVLSIIQGQITEGHFLVLGADGPNGNAYFARLMVRGTDQRKLSP